MKRPPPRRGAAAERRLTVLHVTKRYPNAVGGDAVVVHHLGASQRAAGHDVHVLTSRCDEVVDAPYVHVTGFSLAPEQIDAITLRRVFSLVRTTVAAVPLLARVRPDVVHAHTVDLGIAVSLAARLFRVPRVLTLHGTSIGDPLFSRPKRLVERLLATAGGYRQVLSVDPQAVPRLRGLLSAPVDYAPNAVPLETYPVRDTEPVPGAPLLFVGRLETVKGVDVLLAALARLAQQGVRPLLDVVGAGSQRAALEEVVADLGLGDQVRFLGALPAAEVSERLRTAAALVLPSRFEGFALVLLEAWASGTAVVTTSVGAVPQVCHDGVDSLVVPPDDPAAMAEALARVVSDPALAQRLGIAARKEVEEFYTYSALRERTESLYRSLIPGAVASLPSVRA